MRIDRRAAALALSALAVLLIGAGCSSDEKNAAADVSVTRCDADPSGGQPLAGGEITNNSSKDSGYGFRVIFRDAPGNRVSEGAAAVAKVEAGGKATWEVGGVASAKGPLTCEVTNVVRTAVP